MNESLYRYLHKRGGVPSVDQSLLWARQIAYGMAHLHQLKIVHRDLKSSNILFNSDMEAQICDFGIARPMENTTLASKLGGTLRWMAPEVAEGIHYNKSCDVFSYAMVVWELIEHKLPYHDCTSEVVASMRIISGDRPPFLSEWPKYLKSLIEDGWSDPHNRPPFHDIVTSLTHKMYFRR